MRNVASTTGSFASFFFRAYPGSTTIMVVLLVIAGFAEGFGVLALVPVLEAAQAGAENTSAVGRIIRDALRALHLEPALPALLATVVAAITVKAGVLFIANRQAGYTTARVARDLRLRLVRAVLFARWSYFGQKPIGRFAGAVGMEVNRTSSAYREGCQMLAAFVQVLVYIAVSAWVAWQVTLVTVVAGVALTLLFSRFFRRSRAAGVAQTLHNKALAARLVDVLQGLKPLKAMSREELVWPLLEAETEALNQAQRRAVQAAESRTVFYEPIVTLLLAIGLYTVLTVGGMPLPQVLVLAFIFHRIMGHVNTLQMRYQTVLTGEGAFVSLVEEIEEAESAYEVSVTSSPPTILRESLELRDVWFGYGSAEVLRGLNLEVPAGTFVAITGESGAGKTTLADLLVGLRHPDRGEVLVDGRSLLDIDPSSWRRTIGYVPQELLVFNDTVARNVGLGDASITTAEIERALRLAGAWDFVSQKPGGLDYMIGDRGASLSGGQRQRIAIARALVWRPSLLILDEVTTALDPVTEQEICNTLRQLAGEITILAISHQPALRRAADVAYTLRHGRLVQAEPGVLAR